MTTKEKILKKALQMFNARGTETVTTRHIAAELKMSQGNLHYHYPNKNVLIQTLYDAYAAAAEQLPVLTPGQFDPSEIPAQMRSAFRLMYTYRFLFLDRDTVWRRLPSVKKAMKQAVAAHRQQLAVIVADLQDRGMFRKQLPDHTLDNFMDAQALHAATWLHQAEYLRPSKGVKVYDFFADRQFENWWPYFRKTTREKLGLADE